MSTSTTSSPKTVQKLVAPKPMRKQDLQCDEDLLKHLSKNYFFLKNSEPKPAYKYNAGNVEYFGVLSIVDPQFTNRKLWYLYYCKGDNLDETVEHLREKYGKKHTYEIYRQHTYSGMDLCASTKKYFAERKFFTKGNIIEAPRHETRYTNETIVRAAMDLHDIQQQRLYAYLKEKKNSRT